eukprot:gene23565-9089_t
MQNIGRSGPGGLRVKRFASGRHQFDTWGDDEGVDLDQGDIESAESQAELATAPRRADKGGPRGCRESHSDSQKYGNSVDRPGKEIPSSGAQPYTGPYTPRKPVGLPRSQLFDFVGAPRPLAMSPITRLLAVSLLVCFTLILFMHVQVSSLTINGNATATRARKRNARSARKQRNATTPGRDASERRDAEARDANCTLTLTRATRREATRGARRDAIFEKRKQRKRVRTRRERDAKYATRRDACRRDETGRDAGRTRRARTDATRREATRQTRLTREL